MDVVIHQRHSQKPHFIAGNYDAENGKIHQKITYRIEKLFSVDSVLVRMIENACVAFTIMFPEFGTYNITVTYNGNTLHHMKTENYTVLYSEKYTPTLDILEKISIDYLDDYNFTAKLSYENKSLKNSSLEVTIAERKYDENTDENGVITIPIALDAGEYNITITYKGNVLYNPVNATSALTVNKINTEISAKNTIIAFGEDLTVSVEGNATSSIIAEIESNKYSGTISENIAIIDLSNLANGTYDAKIIYLGDKNYNNNSINSKITVTPLTIDIKAIANPITIGEDAVIAITGLNDATGNITAIVDNKTYFTNIESNTSIIIPGLSQNSTAIIYYAGNVKYDNASTTVEIVVNPKEMLQSILMLRMWKNTTKDLKDLL